MRRLPSRHVHSLERETAPGTVALVEAYSIRLSRIWVRLQRLHLIPL